MTIMIVLVAKATNLRMYVLRNYKVFVTNILQCYKHVMTKESLIPLRFRCFFIEIIYSTFGRKI